MVKKVNNINKNKYNKNNNQMVYIVAGIAIAIIIGITAFVSFGGSSSTALAGPAPGGANCSENIAYLQTGVDKYKEVTGQPPTDLNELTQTKNGKGPFVEKLVSCPSGNLYVVDNGVVREVAKQ